jgi:DNA processing protein
MIYPAQHRDLAMRIVSSGGALVSEYLAGVKPFKPHFLQRNRIVAGLCDATFVVESKVKGGAMSTASLAFNYSREVLALPGRHNDQMSAGCNLLIRQGKATITCSAREALDSLGWNPSSPASLAAPAQQPSLFCNLDGNRRKVYDLLSATSQPVGVDMLVSHTALTLVELASLLYDMEMEGIIMRLPNNRYVLC